MVDVKDNNIIDTKFTDALSERYLAYALSTVMSRSLPDVRDGLKPVHRRILYAMRQLKLDPKSAYKKCARVVGDVIGKYHPHGDVAVYDALVRLAQDFTIRYPLIEGQGNFGSIDGDNPAAMRYTESRLTEIALYLLQDIDEETVNFKSTYDEQDSEPSILPACFPNLLANGTEGIAVGMATSIPPHNIGELCDASLVLLAKPQSTILDLLEYISGPDLPTAGIINETKEKINKIYETGRGSLKVRAVWHKEELPKNNYQIVITQIPYQVQKSKLIEKMAELYKDKKLPLIEDFYDDSAENIALLIKPKNNNIPAELLMESLFKLTDLEYRVSFNMNVLDKNSIPRVMNLKEILEQFLEHRKEVIIKRSKYRLAKIINRLEIVAGLLVVYLSLDEVIRIIRYEDEPKQELMKTFSLSDMQAEAVLNMRLRSLRKLEEMELKKEHNELSEQKTKLEDIIENESSLKKLIKTELNELKNKFGANTPLGKRRTIIDNNILELQSTYEIEESLNKEPITFVCSKLGWVRALKGHNVPRDNIQYKAGDEERFVKEVYNTDKIIIATNIGKFYTLPLISLNITKGDGSPINVLFEFERSEQLVSFNIFAPSSKFLLVSSKGKGFIVNHSDVLAQTKLGKKVMAFSEQDFLFACENIEDKIDSVSILASNRKLLMIKLVDLPEMKKGKGVQLQKQKDAFTTAIKLFAENEGLKWNYLGKERMEMKLQGFFSRRGSSGKTAPIGLIRNNKFN